MTSPTSAAPARQSTTMAAVPTQPGRPSAAGGCPPAPAGVARGWSGSSGGGAAAGGPRSGVSRLSCGADRVAASEVRKSSPRTAASGHQRRSAARSIEWLGSPGVRRKLGVLESCQARQPFRTAEDVVEHGRGEPAGERVLLADVETAQQIRYARHADLGAVAEARTR